MPLKLTDAAIKSAKPKEKSYKLTDGEGLYVEVAPGSVKIFAHFSEALCGMVPLSQNVPLCYLV